MHNPLTGIVPPSLERVILDLRPSLDDDEGKALIKLWAVIKTQQPMLREIRGAISDFYAIPLDELTGCVRKYEVSLARQIFCYLAYKYTRFSLAQIGQYIGLNNHTTVWHAVRKIEKLVLTRPLIEDDVDLLRARISEKVLLRTTGNASC